MKYTYDRDNTDILLSVLKDDDTVLILGEDLKKLLYSGNQSKGRKPISVDFSLFGEVVDKWNKGEITAREAMKQLNLKPNTFYRRIKQFNEKNKPELSEIKKDIDGIRRVVMSDAKDALANVSEKKALLDMEMEIKAEKISAELNQKENIDTLKEKVEKEAADLKASRK